MQNSSVGIYRALRFLATPLRREPVFFVFMYLAFVAARLLENPSANTPAYVFYLENVADLYIICTLLCAFPKKACRWVRLAFYVIGYAAAVSECFISLRFHLLFGPITIQLVRETTPGETGEFFEAYLLSGALVKVLAVFGTMIIFNAAAALLSRRIGRLVRKITPLPIVKAINVAAFPAVMICFMLTFGEKMKMTDFFMSRTTDEAEHCDSHAFHSPLYRIAFSLKFLSLSDGELNVLRDNMRGFQVDSCSHTVPNIILYIGESYNKHHSELYGYRLPTTPHQKAMAADGDLIVFKDAVTPWNVTSNVFKDALSTHSTDQRGSWTDGVLLPAVLKKAGYKVAFITSQFYKSPNLGVVDFNGSFFLNDERLEGQCFDYRNKFRKNYDLTLLHEIKKFPAGRYNFVIFQGMGQHQEYRKRYGKGGEYFRVKDYASRGDLNRNEKQIVADYDNATRYNDYVVARLCSFFRDSDAVVVYMPDHGEEVFDRLHQFGRDHNAEVSADIAYSEFEVPFEIWFSPKARKNHPEIYRNAVEAAEKPFSTDDLPHLIMGLAGVSCKVYNPQRDLLSTTFNAHRRRILKGKVDYDSLMNAEIKSRKR